MIAKIHPTPNGKMLALCDSDLLGKRFEEGELQLDLESQFYKGEEVSDDELEKIIKGIYIINAVGETSIKFLISHDLIEESNVKKVADIPHAQCVVERV